MIPYARQSINQEDIEAVLDVLRSDRLTQGPKIAEFENNLAKYCGANYAVVMNSGTAALQAAFFAAEISQGDEFITSTLTFPATSNVGLWLGAKPVFVDTLPNGNLDPNKIEEKITEKTKAIVPIDFTGRPVELEKIKEIAKKHNLLVIEDACQALGATYKGEKIGSISDFTTFSFHPAKNITTGEGGAVLTNSEEFYKKMKMFVTHGITKENLEIESPGDWYFEQHFLGQNYRLTDLGAALGVSQLKRLDDFVNKRREIVRKYNEAFANLKNIEIPEKDNENVKSAWHLYVIRLINDLHGKRGEIFKKLREAGIGVQVHHVPTNHHPHFQKLGYKKGLTPVAEDLYENIISLPIYPDLSAEDQDKVINIVKKLVA